MNTQINNLYRELAELKQEIETMNNALNKLSEITFEHQTIISVILDQYSLDQRRQMDMEIIDRMQKRLIEGINEFIEETTKKQKVKANFEKITT